MSEKKWIAALIMILSISCNDKKIKTEEKAATYNEGALKSFVVSVPSISKKSSVTFLDSVLNTVSEDSAVFRQTISYLETPLGDPNSSYRNENLYSELLQAKLKSSWYDSASKAQTRNKLYLLMQNTPGNEANDFTYITPAGFKKKMYDLKANYTLLYFYNPECNACKEMKTELTNSTIINAKLKEQKLKLLAIYTDKDEKIWLDHLNEMPTAWMQGRDEDEYLYKNNIYNLKAIPTIYLLDKQKNVLLKDCMDISRIENTLAQTK